MLIWMRMNMSNKKKIRITQMLGITRLETAHSNNDYVADSSPSSHPHAKSLMTFFHPFCVSSSLISC